MHHDIKHSQMEVDVVLGKTEKIIRLKLSCPPTPNNLLDLLIRKYVDCLRVIEGKGIDELIEENIYNVFLRGALNNNIARDI